MKPTFLNQNRPLITGMVLKEDPDSIRYKVKNSIYDGADCLGIQLEILKKEYKTEEVYRKIFGYCAGRPIYITNYRKHQNAGFTDEELAEELLKALSCGATLGDVPASWFDEESGMGIGLELSMKQDAIDKVITHPLLGLPIFDTGFAIIRRLLKGQSPLQADRGHVHHRLIDLGFDQKQSVAILYAFSALMGLTAVILARTNESKLIFLALAVLVCFFLAMTLMSVEKRRSKETQAMLEKMQQSANDEQKQEDNPS